MPTPKPRTLAQRALSLFAEFERADVEAIRHHLPNVHSPEGQDLARSLGLDRMQLMNVISSIEYAIDNAQRRRGGPTW